MEEKYGLYKQKTGLFRCTYSVASESEDNRKTQIFYQGCVIAFPPY